MPSNDLDIKVRLSGARAAQRDADQTGRSVRHIGDAEDHVAKRGRLAALSLNGVERSSHRLRHTAGLLLGVTGIGGLAFGMKEVVHATILAQSAQAKLQRGMKNAGLSWRVYGEDVEKALDKQAEFSGFAKGDVTDSLTNFIRTTGSVSKALKLNAIAADIARTRHVDLAGAQSLVARAYNGSFRGLLQLGLKVPQVTTAQDLLAATTRHATTEQKRHAVALDKTATSTQAVALLQQKFGGQTAAWGKTAEGSVARARVSLEIAQEQIGNILLPYVSRAAQKIAQLAQAFTKNWPEIKTKIKSAVSGIKSALSPLLSFMSAHRKGILEFAGAFAVLAGGLKVISKFGGKSALGGLSKLTGGKILSRFTERGSSPANPVWVAMVGGKGVPGAGGKGGGFRPLAYAGSAAAAVAGGSAAITGKFPSWVPGIGGMSTTTPLFGARSDAQAVRNQVAAQNLAQHGRASAAPAFDAQGFPTGKDIVIHTHVHLDSREVGNGLTRLAKHQLGLR